MKMIGYRLKIAEIYGYKNSRGVFMETNRF